MILCALGKRTKSADQCNFLELAILCEYTEFFLKFYDAVLSLVISDTAQHYYLLYNRFYG